MVNLDMGAKYGQLSSPHERIPPPDDVFVCVMFVAPPPSALVSWHSPVF